MPSRITPLMTYEYVCTGCGHEWEAEQSISAAPLKNCPRCNADLAKRQVSGGQGFILKGGGWYADGYGLKKGSPSSSSAASTTGATSKSSDGAGSGGTGSTGGGGSGGSSSSGTSGGSSGSGSGSGSSGSGSSGSKSESKSATA